MKMPQHIFALTKSEQRVVILIVMALLAVAVLQQYHGRSSQRSARDSWSARPGASPSSEEEPGGDDGR
jgi:hypothetical protein